tara:strand:+ start:1220 stop:1831 length:612 start_codon:yes stop_codon:yes gene_type:complete
MVNVIDIGFGNIHSLQNWVNNCGFDCKIVKRPNDFDDSSIIIPGMCNAYYLMMGLREKMFDSEIIKRANQGQKIIGICAGMQILNKKISESKGCKGLGLVNYVTKKFETTSNKQIINNGWISIELNKFVKFDVLNNLGNELERFYFNHQYYLSNEKINKNLEVESIFAAHKFISCFFDNNIIGLQFHPEKSQMSGFKLGKKIL